MILELQLRDLRARLARQGLTLHITPEARTMILGQGHDPVNGARPLRRTIERMLIRPLSQYLLDDVYPSGSQIEVRVEDERLAMKIQTPSAAGQGS